MSRKRRWRRSLSRWQPSRRLCRKSSRTPRWSCCSPWKWLSFCFWTWPSYPWLYFLSFHPPLIASVVSPLAVRLAHAFLSTSTAANPHPHLTGGCSIAIIWSTPNSQDTWQWCSCSSGLFSKIGYRSTPIHRTRVNYQWWGNNRALHTTTYRSYPTASSLNSP